MAEIKPFKGILPARSVAKNLVVFIERMTLEEAKTERERNPLSYIHMLVPTKSIISIENNKETAFKIIRQNFDSFLQHKYLIEDESPAIYQIEISGRGGVQKGLWALTSIKDYIDGKIKCHEKIFQKREKQIADYLINTRLESLPVLITYRAETRLNELLESCTKAIPDLSLTIQDCEFKVSKIQDETRIKAITDEFSKLPETYIADGHHRAEAAVSAGFNFFSTVYMPVSDLGILPFHRLVKDLNHLSVESFLTAVRRSFHINQLSSFENFSIPGSFNMYLKDLFLNLIPKDHILNRKGLSANMDASLIRDFILSPILKVEESGENDRVEFVAASKEQAIRKVDTGEFAVAFLLNPPSADTILKVADAAEIMPAKSTFVMPKFPVGLIVHREGFGAH